MIIPNQILNCNTCQNYTKLIAPVIRFIGDIEKADVIVFTSNQIKISNPDAIKDGMSPKDYQDVIDSEFKNTKDYNFFSFLTDGEVSRLFITPLVRCNYENQAVSKVCCSTWTKLLMSLSIKYVVIVGQEAKNAIISSDDINDFSLRRSQKYGKVFLYCPDWRTTELNKDTMKPYRDSFLNLVMSSL